MLLATEHVVGRMPSCRLCLPAAFVSLAHAMIRWNGQFWELRDLGSTNGTYLDGSRVCSGGTLRLPLGAAVAFGDERETWRLISDSPPRAAAIPLDGGEARFFVAGAIAIPSSRQPLASIFPEGDGWVLELDDLKLPVVSGQQFVVARREWRFECPSAATSTSAPGDRQLLALEDTRLVFGVSRDEEHVTLSLRGGGALKALGERTCFYLALVLARQRLADKRARLAEHGWLDVAKLLRMVPDYSSYSSLNVEIFRFRRALAEAGVSDAARCIERRRGQVRLGTDRIELEQLGDQQSAAVEPA